MCRIVRFDHRGISRRPPCASTRKVSSTDALCRMHFGYPPASMPRIWNLQSASVLDSARWAGGGANPSHTEYVMDLNSENKKDATCSVFTCDLRLNYHPPSGGRGVSLGHRPAVNEWGKKSAPPAITLICKKPELLSVAYRHFRFQQTAMGWGGHTHPPLLHASAPKTLVYYYCLAVFPFASSFFGFRFAIVQRVSYCCRSVRARASAFGAS